MIEYIFVSIFSLFFLNSCSTLNEINETVKGDGTPYIPGIRYEQSETVENIDANRL